MHDLNIKQDKIESMEVNGIRTIGVSTLENGNLNLDEIFKNELKISGFLSESILQTSIINLQSASASCASSVLIP